MAVAIGVRKRVVAFEPPQREHRAMQHLESVAARELAALQSDCSTADTTAAAHKRYWVRGAVWIRDPRVFALAAFLLSEEGARLHPQDHAATARATVNAVLASNEVAQRVDTQDTADGSKPRLYCQDELEPILRFCWPSARRAVRFVNAVVSLVTANAYISTLGGGHFLCKHLDQAKVLAKLQIAVSVGLQDPVLESKCRVNLAYGAMQRGRFRHALRIIERERTVATALASDELEKICHAAKVYLLKTYRLHQEYLRTVSDLGKSEQRLYDNFYRQRIVRVAK